MKSIEDATEGSNAVVRYIASYFIRLLFGPQMGKLLSVVFLSRILP
jgi:hypothetical protein